MFCQKTEFHIKAIRSSCTIKATIWLDSDISNAMLTAFLDRNPAGKLLDRVLVIISKNFKLSVSVCHKSFLSVIKMV